ncbi:MAG: MarC family protein [Dehalococcoidia bacterium]|nr:MarC family protein [Dehalococcoidia bacterium]
MFSVDSYGKDFLLSFVPLLVAIDAIGTVPIILALSEGSSRWERFKMVNIALFTALTLGLGFLFAGRTLLRFLSIEVDHFAIAGGIVLLVLAIKDLVGQSSYQIPDKREMIAVVPIGTPLTVGPATLATLLILSDQSGYDVVLPAFVANIAIAWVVFLLAGLFAAFLGKGGLQALSKVSHLFLAAIAVRLIVTGLDRTLHLTQ